MSQTASTINLGQLIRHYGGLHRWAIVTGAGLLLATNALGLLIPWQAKQAIDLLADGKVEQRAFQIVIAILLAAAVGQALVRVLSRWVLFGIGRSVEKDIRSALFRFFLRQEPAYYEKQSVGDLVSRLANDIGTVRMLFGFGLLNIFNTVFAFSLGLGMMLIISPWLTLYALAPFPLLFWILKRFSGRLHAVFLDVQNQLGDMSGFLQEVVSGLEIVQNFGAADAFKEAFDGHNERYYEANVELALVRGLMMPIIILITGAGGVVILGFGGWQVMGGQITLGSFVAFEGYLAMLIWPTMVFGWLFNIIQRGRASLQRIGDTMQATISLPEQVDVPWGGATLCIRNFSANQSGDEARPVFALGPVDLEVQEGRWIGIAGATGSGKSVLLRALLGFIDHSGGTLLCNGKEVRPENLRAFRRQIAYVPTQPLLFSGTIRENLDVVSGKGLSNEQIWSVLASAGLAADVRKFGRQLDTMIGERGVTLSGGQQQRLGIARALLLERPILFLDDCLSAVDSENEFTILTQLHRDFDGSILLATHRVSQLAGCDSIVVLDHGKVVEKGHHKDLLRANGTYSRLHTRQDLEEMLELT